VKLALIRRQFSATGGAELYLQRLLDSLAKAGHQLHLFTEAWSEKPAGVVFHAVALGGTRAQRPLRFAESVRHEVAKEKFDCVFSLERTLKQDVYRAGDGVHRVWLQRRRDFAPWWKKPFVGLGAFHRNMMALEAQTFDPANTRHIIVNSEMVKREILANFQFPADRIHLVRNGVDVARFRNGKRAETRARFGIEDDDFLLLFVGSGWERKGLKFLIGAMQELAKPLEPGGMMETMIRLDAKGEDMGGDKLQRIVAQAKKTKLLVLGKGSLPNNAPSSVIFAGSTNDVQDAYAAADLFVFPPIYEPSSNVVFEALAAGLPVVTSIQNGAAELIDEGKTGTVLADPSNIQAMLEAIGYWRSHRCETAIIDENALGIERNVAETMTVLEIAASERGVQ
jgi:UDP-glucose:(heptosyl)LPS alpha-1,3-glucosyltransferase